MQAVTTTQVKEAMTKCVAGKKKVLIEYLPASLKPATKEKAGPKR